MLIRKLKAAGMLLAALFALVVAVPAAAQATPPPAPKLTAAHAVSCGKVAIEVVNTARWAFSADVRVDDEPGVDDVMTGKTIAGGPHKGKPFGQRYTVLAVPAGQTGSSVTTFEEDSGAHKVAYRVWRGPENDWYLDWVTVTVESNCQPEPTGSPSPTPTATASPEPSATASPDPTASASPAPSTSPAASGGDQLPLTGSPVVAATVLGAVLVVAGVAMLVRRRRNRYEA